MSYVRPSLMSHVGSVYFPEGLPTANFSKFVTWNEYYDEYGHSFVIVYTHDQVMKNLSMNKGVFNPYIPIAI